MDKGICPVCSASHRLDLGGNMGAHWPGEMRPASLCYGPQCKGVGQPPAGPTDLEVVDAMTNYGGSFAQALAEAFRRADLHNTMRLKDAFPEYWLQYSEFALRCRAKEVSPS